MAAKGRASISCRMKGSSHDLYVGPRNVFHCVVEPVKSLASGQSIAILETSQHYCTIFNYS